MGSVPRGPAEGRGRAEPRPSGASPRSPDAGGDGERGGAAPTRLPGRRAEPPQRRRPCASCSRRRGLRRRPGAPWPRWWAACWWPRSCRRGPWPRRGSDRWRGSCRRPLGLDELRIGGGGRAVGPLGLDELRIGGGGRAVGPLGLDELRVRAAGDAVGVIGLRRVRGRRCAGRGRDGERQRAGADDDAAGEHDDLQWVSRAGLRMCAGQRREVGGWWTRAFRFAVGPGARSRAGTANPC